ncbi:MAG TPA: SDR family oxidoreductase [Caulobacteraceae bacterium]|nr:SDR family oxidoreductase [Caulobacteraceae bacterium]
MSAEEVPSDPARMFRLDGRIAIVTGASSGLGARFARVMSSAGASVVLTARRSDRLAALSDELGGALWVAGDVTDDSHIHALVEQTVDRHGRIDILVNCAGLAEQTPLEDEPIDDIRRMIAVNLTAVIALNQAVGRRMLAQASGVIVNVASMFGLVAPGDRPMTGYAATKGAVINHTRDLAAQWATRGIRVNAIAPGFFPTELTAMLSNPDLVARIERRTLMQRPGAIHELDGALLFLTSDASSYVTGHTLVVDGGWTAW